MAFTQDRLGRSAKALRFYDRAVLTTVDNATVRYNRFPLHLRRGALAEGWADFACRFLAKPRTARHGVFHRPEWDGSPLDGRRLLIWREQGIGDEIMFSSCYDEPALRAGHPIIECSKRLIGLFRRSFPHGDVREDGATAPEDADLQIAAGSLPRLFRDRLSRFPVEREGWLVVDPERKAFWADRVRRLGQGLRVGISWRSMLMNFTRNSAYVPLERWFPFFEIDGLIPVNLQYAYRQEELDGAARRFGVRIANWTDIDLKDDFEATAALIANLDAVVAPCNAVAELAAALGVPVLRFSNPDWTQLGATGIRPWSPTMRLFTPMAYETVENAIGRISQELLRLRDGG